MNIRARLPIICLLILVFAAAAYPCTVAVISGKATPDGRPLLWKNRDSSHESNSIQRFTGEKYTFIGVINAEEQEDVAEIWSGVNDAGFCIMNSASYNVNADEKKREKEEKGFKRRVDEEGSFMALALGKCATVDEFEQFLMETKGERGVSANFGVIDANGGAAFFETENNSYVRFDANDQRFAPEGYIVRTNYSYTGIPLEGAGYIRFDRASKLFIEAIAAGGISLDWLLLYGSRDMVNSLSGTDPLHEQLPVHAGDQTFYYAHDSIIRSSACSTTVFQGVKPGDDPVNTIMWARVGHPLTSVAIPHWLASYDEAKLCVGQPECTIGGFSLALKRTIFPLTGGSRDRYMDLAPVINAEGNGFMKRLVAIEKDVLALTKKRLAGEATDLKAVQREVEDLVTKELERVFPEYVELLQ